MEGDVALDRRYPPQLAAPRFIPYEPMIDTFTFRHPSGGGKYVVRWTQWHDVETGIEGWQAIDIWSHPLSPHNEPHVSLGIGKLHLVLTKAQLRRLLTEGAQSLITRKSYFIQIAPGVHFMIEEGRVLEAIETALRAAAGDLGWHFPARKAWKWPALDEADKSRRAAYEAKQAPPAEASA